MIEDIADIDKLGSKQVRWIIGVQKRCITQNLQTIDQIIEQTYSMIGYDKQKMQIYIRDDEKYLQFDKNIQKMFNKKDQIVIQYLYNTPKLQQQKRIQQLIRKSKMLQNQLQGKLQNQAEGIDNLLKLQSRKSKHQQSRYKKTVKICLLVADPLLSTLNQPIHREQSDIEKLQQIIYETFRFNSINIDLILCRYHLNKHCLKNLNKILTIDNHQYDALVLHVMTSLFEDNGTNYLVAEHDGQKVGMTTKISFKQFLNYTRQLKNLYCIMFSGCGIALMKNKQANIKEKINVPIFGVSTFDLKADQQAQQFLNNFYSNLFSRKNLVNWFTDWNTKIVEKKFTCCCIHDDPQDQKWQKASKMLGLSVIHKILCHKSYRHIYKRKDSLETHKLINIIIQEQDIKSIPFKCYHPDSFKIHCKNRSNYYIKIEQESQKNIVRLQYPKQKQLQLINSKGDIRGNFGKINFERQRPKIIAQIIKKILVVKNVIVCVSGEPRSGKYNSICLAQRYIQDRVYPQLTNGIKIKFDKLSEQFETMSVPQLENIIEDKLKLVPKGYRLIFKLNKINAAHEKKLDELAKFAKKIPYKYHDNSICFVASSQHIHKFSTVDIGQLTDSEIKYMILRQFGVKYENNPELDARQYIEVLKTIIPAKMNALKKIPFLDLSQYLKNLYAQQKVSKPQKIESDIQDFLKRTQTMLNKLKNQEYSQFWKFLGLISMFKQGFVLSKVNQRILKEQFKINFNLIKKITQTYSEAKKNNIPLFQMTQLMEQSTDRPQSNKWKILLRPQNIMRDYYLSKQATLIKLKKFKILYFSSFFNYFIHIIKYSESSPFYSSTYSAQGIFQFNIGQPTINIKDISDVKTLKFAQRKYLFKDLYLHHKYSYISFLRTIGEKIDTEFSFLQQKDHYRKQLLFSLLNFMITEKLLIFFLPGIFTNYVAQPDDDDDNQNSTKTLNQQIIDLLKQIKTYTIQQKILKFQNMALISYGSLNLVTFQQKLSPQQKIVKLMIMYEKKKYAISNMKSELQQLTHRKNRNFDKQNKQQQISSKIQKIGILLKDAIRLLSQQIAYIQRQIQSKYQIKIITDNFINKLRILLFKLIVKKVLIKFQNNIQTSPDHRHQFFSTNKLIQELNFWKKQCDKNKCLIPSNIEKQIILCHMYLQEKSDALTKQLNFAQNQVPNQALQLYKYITYKINPKKLLQNHNIILFMKARCLTIQDNPCCFVRKGNIIKSFLNERLKNKSVTLFFLNLSRKNFDMVSQVKKSIPYFVLSVDTIKQGDHLKMVFEHSTNSQEVIIDYSTFIHKFKHIQCLFLIIFGSQSEQLAANIRNDVDHPIYIFSFSLDKKFTLSTYPQKNSSQYQHDISKIVTNFLQIQQNHRMMELIACALITLLVREKKNQIQMNRLEQLANKSIRYSQDVIIKWYRDKKVTFDNSFRFTLHSSISAQQKISYFPLIQSGKLNDLTSAINLIPKNFIDDEYYEMIGRVQELSRVVKELAERRKSLIQILGTKKCGKTQFLKEIAWFCQTRDIFGLGVYFFDMDKIRENHMSIMQYLIIQKQESLYLKIQKNQNQFSGKNYLLLLFDNINADDIGGDNRQFFENLSRGPNAIVFSSSSDLKLEFKDWIHEEHQQSQSPIKITHHNSHSGSSSIHHIQSPRNHSHLITFRRKSTTTQQKIKFWHWTSLNLNYLTRIQQICISLIHIRNRNNQQYQQILQQILEDGSQQITSIQPEQSSLDTLLKKLNKYKQSINYKGIIRNYLQYDSKKLMKMTDTVQKIMIKIRR